MERLVELYASQLVKQHQVSVLGHSESIFPSGVSLLKCEGGDDFITREVNAFQSWHWNLKNFDVIHDFSHLHLASRHIPNLPSLNIFWHAPSLGQYPKAPYNIIALSQWAAFEFRRYYHQNAKYQQSIAIDTSVYYPLGKRGERFMCLGRMAPEKGNLNAILACKKAGVPLDVCGGRGAGRAGSPYLPYELRIISLCDGEKIRFLGEVTEEDKLRLMRSCKGLIYFTDHPEVINHKLQEAMLCKAPVIAPNIGAQPEIVTHGDNGFLASSLDDVVESIKNIDSLKMSSEVYDALRQKYDLTNVVNSYITLYKQVSEGLRW